MTPVKDLSSPKGNSPVQEQKQYRQHQHHGDLARELERDDDQVEQEDRHEDEAERVASSLRYPSGAVPNGGLEDQSFTLRWAGAEG